MKGIITVLGRDRVGIIAAVCAYLAQKSINILDISQTILDGFFNMVMIVDLSAGTATFEETAKGLREIGESLCVSIKLQREEIFDIMHRV